VGLSGNIDSGTGNWNSAVFEASVRQRVGNPNAIFVGKEYVEIARFSIGTGGSRHLKEKLAGSEGKPPARLDGSNSVPRRQTSTASALRS